MDSILRVALRSVFKRGNLRVTGAGGTVFHVGDGTGHPIAIRFTMYRAVQWAAMFDPELRSWRGRTWTARWSSTKALTAISSSSRSDRKSRSVRRAGQNRTASWRFLGKRLKQFNLRERARRNVAHHYDLDGRLYALFLDSDRQQTAAPISHPNASLDDAQLAKKRHLAAKLLITPGARVLYIGSGWGGLAIYMAKFCDAQVTGVTLSQEQLAVARQRASDENLTDRLEFRLEDYRDITEKFDRIVSVGMFEHVGVGYYDAYFKKCAEGLADDGVILMHSIGRSEGPSTTNAWIAKYIFPAATSRRCPRCCPRSNGRDCSSTTSKSCACITPKR